MEAVDVRKTERIRKIDEQNYRIGMKAYDDQSELCDKPMHMW